jgi:hypothetical protein
MKSKEFDENLWLQVPGREIVNVWKHYSNA